MPQITAHNKIVLKGDFGQHEEGVLATAPAMPGMNVVLTNAAATQKRDTYAPGATLVGGTAGTAAASPIKVVKEDALTGRTVETAYAVGENLLVYLPKKGDVIQVLVASGQTVTKNQQGWAIASGKWNGGAAGVNGVGEFLEASGGALAADTLMRLRVF